MSDLGPLFERLSKSRFRSGFAVKGKDLIYFREKGLPVIMEHASQFIDKRLSPEEPANDGKQTPMRGHPVFIAQHATATCCRGCLQKWHSISKGHELSPEEKAYVLRVLEKWLTDSI